MAKPDEIEKLLATGGICEQSLKEMANVLAAIENDDVRVEDVLVNGITNPDLAEIRIRVAPSAVGGVIERFTASGLRPEFQIFPRGIIAPDRLEVVARVGNRMR